MECILGHLGVPAHTLTHFQQVFCFVSLSPTVLSLCRDCGAKRINAFANANPFRGENTWNWYGEGFCGSEGVTLQSAGLFVLAGTCHDRYPIWYRWYVRGDKLLRTAARLEVHPRVGRKSTWN